MSHRSDITAADYWFIGEDKVIPFVVYTDTTTQDEIDAGHGTPEDISGWTLEFIVRRDPETTSAVITKTSGSGVNITDAANGECEVLIDSVDTDPLDPTVYSYALSRTDFGNEGRLAHGDAVIQLSAAR